MRMLQALIVFCFMWAVGPAVAADVARSKSPACDIVLSSSVPTLIEQSQLVGGGGLSHDTRLQRK